MKTATELMPPDACATALKDFDYPTKKLALLQKPCNDLAQKMCDAVAPDADLCQSLTTTYKKNTPDRCADLMEHFPEVAARIQKQRQSYQPLSADVQTALSQSGGGVSFGPASAKVQVVEFVDFESRNGALATRVVHQIEARYGERVRFTLRQFPQPTNSNARAAAEAVLAANAQGEFWELHDRLFANQNDRAGLEEQAKQIGLDLTAFKKSLDRHEFAAIVDADIKLGQQAAVDPPTLFINGARANPVDFEAAASTIEAALNEQVLSSKQLAASHWR